MAANPHFIENVITGYLATTPVFKALLVDPDYAPTIDDVGTETAAAHEIVGVARPELAGVAVSLVDPDVQLTCDNLEFDALDGTTDVGGVVIYVEGASEAENLIVSWDLDDGPFTPPAGVLTYVVDDGFAIFSA